MASKSFTFLLHATARLITGVRWNDHIMPTLRDTLHWLPVSKLRWWHTTVSMADHQCTSVTSVHRSSPFTFVLGFVLLTVMTWLCHVLGPRIMVRAVSASRHPRFGTSCHLILRTVMLVSNTSSRALRLGSLCKPTHKRHLWELCLSGALQILDLIWFLFLSSSYTWLAVI